MYMRTPVLRWTSNEKGEQTGLQRLKTTLYQALYTCVWRNIVSVLYDCVCSVCECESIDRF